MSTGAPGGLSLAGFALTPSAYPADWDWYTTLSRVRLIREHLETTSAILRVEDRSIRRLDICRNFQVFAKRMVPLGEDLRQNPT